MNSKKEIITTRIGIDDRHCMCMMWYPTYFFQYTISTTCTLVVSDTNAAISLHYFVIYTLARFLIALMQNFVMIGSNARFHICLPLNSTITGTEI